MKEDINPFEQEFPDVSEHDEKIKKAIDIVIAEIDAKTELIDLEFDDMRDETVYITASANIHGTAESGEYDEGYIPTSSLEDKDFNYDESDLEQHIAEALKIANDRLAAEGLAIRFSDPEIECTDYSVEDIEDYDTESGDDGIGSYEYWGFKGYDSRPYTIAVDITWSGYANIGISILCETPGENMEEGAVGDLMKDIGHGIKQGFKSFKQARTDRKDNAVNAELSKLLINALDGASLLDRNKAIADASKMLTKGESFDDVVKFIRDRLGDYIFHAGSDAPNYQELWDKRTKALDNLSRMKKQLLKAAAQ